MYAVAIKQRAFLLMIAITSLSTKRNSHDISVKTSNTYSSQLTALQICRFLHVRGPAAGAKPQNIGKEGYQWQVDARKSKAMQSKTAKQKSK